jgi:hypothetical protein
MSKSTITLSLFLLLAACDTPAGSELDGESQVEASGESELDGKPVCGERTVASVRTPSGSRVEFCVDDAGGDLLMEHALIGDRSALADVEPGACGLETFLALTADGTPVPRALVDSCVAQGGNVDLAARRIVDEPVHLTSADEDEKPRAATDFCAANGEELFADEVCGFINFQCGFTDSDVQCSFWCRPMKILWHQKSSHNHLSIKPFEARDELAACVGRTRARAWFFRDGEWRIAADQTVFAGNVLHQLYTNKQLHVRFRGDSDEGAWHRYAGRFWGVEN